VPDLTHFYAQYASIKPWIETQTPAPADSERLPSKEDREKLDGLYDCVLCACARPVAQLLVEQRALPGACDFASSLPLAGRQPRRTTANGWTNWKTRLNCTVAIRL